MEERLPSPQLPPPPPPPPPHRDDHRHPVPDVPPPPRYRNSTYVVQVPKDQIYRVPPPEHAAFIERYHTGSVAPQRSPCSSCFCSALCFFFLLLFLLAFLGALIYLVVRPSLPQFSITNVRIGHPAWSSSQRSPSNPKYEFTMKADNGNPVMSVQYYRGGSASLLHKGQEIASGQISHFDQNAAESTPFRITFTGKDSLPLELQKKDAIVKLVLSSDLPMKMKIGGLSLPGMDLYVACEVKMKKTSEGMQISSQSCKSNFWFKLINEHEIKR